MKLAPLLVLLAALSACGRCQPPADSPASPIDSSPQTSTPSRTGVIDTHTHIGDTAYPLMMRLADQEGIERIVNLSGGHQGQPGGLAPHLKAMADHPGRIAVFYNIAWAHFDHPRFAQIIADGLEEAVGLGYAGVKVSKALGLAVRDQRGAFVAVDDPRLDPIWSKAGELGVPVAIHTGDPKAFFEALTPENERYEELSQAPTWSFADERFPRRQTLLRQRDNLLRRHRDTRFILVHFGNNPEDIDDVERLLDTHPNAWLDVAARLGEIGRHDPQRVKALFSKHRSRILFGTDLGVHTTREDDSGYSLFLGSISKVPPTLTSVGTFYSDHWRFFETDPVKTPQIDHPIPIQGSWRVHPLGLAPDVLADLYRNNAYDLIFAPMHRRMGTKDPLHRP